jgi:hypothetical protein
LRFLGFLGHLGSQRLGRVGSSYCRVGKGAIFAPCLPNLERQWWARFA